MVYCFDKKFVRRPDNEISGIEAALFDMLEKEVNCLVGRLWRKYGEKIQSRGYREEMAGLLG